MSHKKVFFVIFTASLNIPENARIFTKVHKMSTIPWLCASTQRKKGHLEDEEFFPGHMKREFTYMNIPKPKEQVDIINKYLNIETEFRMSYDKMYEHYYKLI